MSMKNHWGTTYSDIMILVSYKISKDTATTRSKKWQFSMTSLSFDAPIQRTPMNIGITLTYNLVSLRYISAAGSMCLYFIQILVMGSERQAHNVTRVNYCRSRPSKVIDFATYQKRVYTFLLVINSNLDPILHRFRNMAA